jgi:hypothetical protein
MNPWDRFCDSPLYGIAWWASAVLLGLALGAVLAAFR